MSSARDLVLWGLAPFVVGAALASLVPRSPKATAPDTRRQAPAARPLPSGAPDPEVRAPARESTSVRCEALVQELAWLDGLVPEWFGEAEPWPEGVTNPLLGEEGFATWMEAFAADLPGVGVVEVDCAQYPCIGIWRAQGLISDVLMEEQGRLGVRSHMRLMPINDAEGETTHWMVAVSLFESNTADPALVSVRMSAALSANGDPMAPDDPEAAVPFFGEP